MHAIRLFLGSVLQHFFSLQTAYFHVLSRRARFEGYFAQYFFVSSVSIRDIGSLATVFQLCSDVDLLRCYYAKNSKQNQNDGKKYLNWQRWAVCVQAKLSMRVCFGVITIVYVSAISCYTISVVNFDNLSGLGRTKLEGKRKKGVK